MTKNTTRKKAADKPVEPTASDPQPMDSGPIASGTPTAPITQRPVYAAVALVAEVNTLFGTDVPHEFSGSDQFWVMHDVEFDTSVLDADDAKTLARLLTLTESDARVREVLVDDNGQVLVSILSHPVRQEDRSSFGLAEAAAILSEEEK